MIEIQETGEVKIKLGNNSTVSKFTNQYKPNDPTKQDRFQDDFVNVLEEAIKQYRLAYKAEIKMHQTANLSNNQGYAFD